MHPFEIQIKPVDTRQGFSVKVTGSLDIKTALELEKTCLRVFAGRTERVVFDFSELDYINSQGLGVLMLLQKELSPGGGGVVVAGMPDRVRSVFITTGVNQVIGIYPTLAEALAHDPLFQESGS